MCGGDKILETFQALCYWWFAKYVFRTVRGAKECRGTRATSIVVVKQHAGDTVHVTNHLYHLNQYFEAQYCRIQLKLGVVLAVRAIEMG
jgi:hypothetical protein